MRQGSRHSNFLRLSSGWLMNREKPVLGGLCQGEKCCRSSAMLIGLMCTALGLAEGYEHKH